MDRPRLRATLAGTKEAAVNARTLKEASTCVMVGSALAFLVVLFLNWHRTTVDIAGVAAGIALAGR